MKKRFLLLSTIVLFSTLVFIPGCGGEKSTAGSGSTNLLKLLPANPAAVFSVNVKKMSQLPFFDKMIQDAEKKNIDKPGKIFENYQDFVTKTGIDPKKDIYAIALGAYGELGSKDNEVAFVVNLKYNKDTVLGILKAKGAEFSEETYKDVTIYKAKEEMDKEMGFTFLTDQIIAGGTPALLNQVIDLHKGTGKSVMDTAKMKNHLESLKHDAIVTFVLDLPEEAKKVHDSGMFKMDLSKAEVIKGFFDYDNKTWKGELTLVSHNEEANQQLVSTLNGLKMMAGAAGPEVAELIKNLTLTASAHGVTLEVSISEALLEKLQAKFAEKSKGMMSTPPPPAEEEAAEPEKK
jgi:hypothetical protein